MIKQLSLLTTVMIESVLVLFLNGTNSIGIKAVYLLILQSVNHYCRLLLIISFSFMNHDESSTSKLYYSLKWIIS